MKQVSIWFGVALGSLLWSSIALADVTCTNKACSYVGRVASVYVNDQESVLAELDASYSELLADVSGVTDTKRAISVPLAGKESSSRLILSTLHAAFLSGVKIEMRHNDGQVGGIRRFDRITLLSD